MGAGLIPYAPEYVSGYSRVSCAISELLQLFYPFCMDEKDRVATRIQQVDS